MVTFLNLLAAEPDICRVPIMPRIPVNWSVIEAGLKCIQGKPVINSISMKEGEAEFIHHAKLARRYGAAVTCHGHSMNRARPIRCSAKWIFVRAAIACWLE